MTTKPQALALLHEQYDHWETLLARLSDAQIIAPHLDDGWSIKDVIAHLHDWQSRSVARFEAAHNGTEPRYPDWPEQFDPEIEEQPNDLNAWLYAQTRDQPWQTVYTTWRDSFVRLLELGEATPEEIMLDKQRYSWLEGYALLDVLTGSAEHHQEHAEFLAPVLAQLGT